MLTARDELSHLADTLTEDQADRALIVLYCGMPELYPDPQPGQDDDKSDEPRAIPNLTL